MQWRHLCLARAWSAAGLLSGLILGASAWAEPDDPLPVGQPESQTVAILDASRSGELTVNLRGQGADRVRILMNNTSARRLNVVIPPGLVASSVPAQGAGGRGGGGGGFQSMGLGAVSNTPGSFGRFQNAVESSGLQSVGSRARQPAQYRDCSPGPNRRVLDRRGLHELRRPDPDS